MNQPHTLRLSSWARLVGLALLLGVGLLASLGLASKTAHAQPAATSTVSTCDESHLDSAISNAASGDTITFGCSGTITLSQTLVINKNLTLDGSGRSVTLDGNNSVQVLSVNSGVTFTLNALTIAHGSSNEASGLYSDRSTVNISNSTVVNNFAGCSGGGLYNDGGTMNISNSTIANNSTGCGGGGLVNGFSENNGMAGTMNISNSTVVNNSAFDGGGLYNEGPVTITNSTFANNSVSTDGGGLYNNNGMVSISGSIVANNTGGNCLNSSSVDTITSTGYNLESGTDCGFTGTGDLQNTDPKLASALASNGGPTQTLALLDGSPAINKIPASACAVTTDQRGISRPQGPACDIGAFEFRVPKLSLPGTITVNATSSQGAVVSYTVTASEPDDASATPTVSCLPASGSTFPNGTTKVNCTASDAANPPDTTSGSFQVVVKDTDLGLTNLPTNMTVNATSPQGAVVTYTPPTVVDEDSPLPPVNCTPASGSTFPIGTTTVTCKVSNSDDTPSSVSQTFTVTVNGAATQVSNLITTVNSFHLPSGFQNSFDGQLQAVQADLQAGNTAQACTDLTSFINHAQAQSGKALTVSQANQLIAAARQVQAVLGC